MMDKARKIAQERWKSSELNPSAPGNSKMGIVFGSVHQLYACKDEETLVMVSEKLSTDVSKLLQMNKQVCFG